MINLKFAILFLFLGVSVYAAPNAPENKGAIGAETNARLFYQWTDDLTLINQFTINDSSVTHLQKGIELGARYSLLPELKFGFFVSRIFGVRHDNDWEKTNGVWQWNEVNGRGETIVQPEVIGRHLINEWMFEFRVRAAFSSLDHENTWKLRPAVYYNGCDSWTWSLSDEINFPMNYGENSVNGQWIYLGGLYHLSSHLFLGPSIGFSTQTWTTSAVYRQLKSDHYSMTQTQLNFGLNANFYY